MKLINPSVESTSSKHRKLSDEELDTGDDEDRIDRVETTVEKAAKEPELANILAASIGRHAGPQPSDNEVWAHSRFEEGTRFIC